MSEAAPRAAAGEAAIEIWCLDRRLPGAERFRRHDLLDAEERARRDRYFREEDRDRFTLGRGLARSALAGLIGPAAPLRFALEDFGRPVLAGRPQGPWFNIAHSGAMVVLALSAATSGIGIDVEAEDRQADVDALAHTVCSWEEQAWLARLEGDARRRGFFSLWTLKEAYLKAIGLGFQREPARQVFSLEAGEARAVRLDLPEGDRLEDWQIRLWRLPGGYQMAAAARTAAAVWRVRSADLAASWTDLPSGAPER